MFKNTSLGMPTLADIKAALSEVKDPEIPAVSLVDLNVVRDILLDGSRVSVRIVPTFSGCPAMELMRREVEEKLRGLGIDDFDVRIDRSAGWSTDELSEEVREKLRAFAIAPPPRKGDSLMATLLLPVPCPFCSSTQTRLDSEFGSTLCKQLFYCPDCRQSFERFKPL